MNDDDLDVLLRALPSDDLDGARREAIRDAGHRELATSPPRPSSRASTADRVKLPGR